MAACDRTLCRKDRGFDIHRRRHCDVVRRLRGRCGHSNRTKQPDVDVGRSPLLGLVERKVR